VDFDNLLEHLHDKGILEEERKKGPFTVPRAGDDPAKFTPGQLFAMLVNPFYAGILPYPALIDDETWIGVQCRLVDHYGPELVFRGQLDAFRDVMSLVKGDDEG